MKRLRAPILTALVLRPLLREKLRTLLTIGGIAVGVAVIVAIQLSNQSALRSFSESVDAIAGRANFQIAGNAGTVDENVLLALQPFWNEGVRFAPVIDIDGAILPDDAPIRILAVDLFSDLHFRDYKYTRISTASEEADAGTASQFLGLFRNDSIVVSETFARERKLAIGSPLRVRAAGRDAQFVVRGILRSTGAGSAFSGSIAVADIAVAQRAFAMAGTLSRIDVMVPEKGQAETLGQLRTAVPAHLRLEPPSRRNERVGKMLRAFRINLFALAGVALLVGVFLVYNTVLISVLRRRRDIGISKTLGVSGGQIVRAFILEGALLGFVGSLLGIALGYVLSYATLDLIGRTVNALYVATNPTKVVLSGWVFAGAIAVGTGISIVAALQPAIEAAKLRPTHLIRPGIYQPIASDRSRLLTYVAILALAASAVTSRIPPVGGIAIGGYVSVLCAVAGFALIAPLALRLVATALTPMMSRIFRMSGRLAARAIPSSLRRTAVATAALAIAIGMMVAIAVMVGSFRETVRVWVAQTVQSDLWIRPARALSNTPSAGFPAAMTAELRKLKFIEAFDRISGRDAIFRDSMISIGSADFAVAISHGSLPMIKPRSDDAAMRDALAKGGVLISESLALKFGLEWGEVIELPVADGVHSFPISGIYRDYSNDRGVAVMDRALYTRLYRDDTIQTVAVFLTPGITPDDARAAVERTLGPRFHAFGVTNSTIRAEVMRIFDQTFMITYALLIVAIVVAVLGIINTLSALILERRREIALLRVLGMSRGEVRAMILLEASIIGIVATLIGIIAGYVLSLILIYVINKQSFGWTIEFHPPLLAIAGSLVMTLVATVLAGLVPSRLATQIELSSELKGE